MVCFFGNVIFAAFFDKSWCVWIIALITFFILGIAASIKFKPTTSSTSRRNSYEEIWSIKQISHSCHIPNMYINLKENKVQSIIKSLGIISRLPITSQLSRWNFRAVLWLVERWADVRNFGRKVARLCDRKKSDCFPDPHKSLAYYWYQRFILQSEHRTILLYIRFQQSTDCLKSKENPIMPPGKSSCSFVNPVWGAAAPESSASFPSVRKKIIKGLRLAERSKKA